ncbi:hypothetical protein HALLA_08295 [Halostagnicola larsenii XH-48]|uniref:Uncharacterized protein n=1 Tax=Halostagnicola larsenii XH-48 TaxID=797299 RepID=W0JU93_9EURY|nr:hypothetical protein [Halostagnicola larsenii]AHG00800.1 hypothetical protein HALLA_08295 [Halostagnicola larsenii XH-48]
MGIDSTGDVARGNQDRESGGNGRTNESAATADRETTGAKGRESR